MSDIKKVKWDEKQKVQYCIPIWLRDEQIKVAIESVPGRIEKHEGDREEPIAVVCYGPSLNDTWEEIKKFKYVLTCSGAHKFLIDRGIIPTWHIDVDPREHKIKLIGQPHPDVEYLMASTCHPKMWEFLKGHNVKLWHVFDNSEDALRVLPRGEWAMTGGSSVGLRGLTIARFLGFTKQHIFGMDGSEGKTGKHAAEHPNQPTGHIETEYNGVTYRTTTSMLECARQTPHELSMLRDVEATFYGEGLCQAIMRDNMPERKGKAAFYAIQKPSLISATYRDLNSQLHRENLAYGVGGGRHAKIVTALCESLKSQSVLDYGCGKGYLQKNLPFPIWEYDPAIPGKDEPPRPADLVVCTDVLEHIEPDKIRFVIDDLARCVRKVGYFVIHTGPSTKTLADGRNSHLIQEGEEWWSKRLSEFFQVAKTWKVGVELHVCVGPKPKPSKTKPQENQDESADRMGPQRAACV